MKPVIICFIIALCAFGCGKDECKECYALWVSTNASDPDYPSEKSTVIGELCDEGYKPAGSSYYHDAENGDTVQRHYRGNDTVYVILNCR